MKEFLGEVIFHVKGFFFLKGQAIKMKLAMRLSDIKQKAFNKRFHVIIISYTNEKGKTVNKLRSICNKDFKYYKLKGWLPKRMSYLDLSKKSLYSTSIGLNNTAKRKEREKALKRYMRVQKLANNL